MEQVNQYVSGCRPPERNENDHCLLACQVRVGRRRGVLLLDSGYHVARTVCVMADRLSPHTGERKRREVLGVVSYRREVWFSGICVGCRKWFYVDWCGVVLSRCSGVASQATHGEDEVMRRALAILVAVNRDVVGGSDRTLLKLVS